MSRYMGSRTEGQPPPHVPKTTNGRPPHKTNTYVNLKPSEQRNTAGQRRIRRADAMLARRIEEGE